MLQENSLFFMKEGLSGFCEFHFETGTEGVFWAFHDSDSKGYTGLRILENNDYLIIYSPTDSEKIVWKGIIDLFRGEDETIKEVFGFRIHNEQKGIDKEAWVKFFLYEYPARLITAKSSKITLFGVPLKLVILDVDGVILDLLACFQKNLEYAAGKMSLPFEPIRKYLRDVKAGRIKGYFSFSKTLSYFWPILNKEEIVTCLNYIQEAESLNPYPPCQGSIETIRWLKKHNISVALCTRNNRKSLLERLRNTGIEQNSFVYMSTLDDEFEKPDPRALDPVFKNTSLPPEYMVYLGDWYPDLEIARAAHIRFIAVLSGGIPLQQFLKEKVPHDHIIEKLADLPKLIRVKQRASKALD